MVMRVVGRQQQTIRRTVVGESRSVRCQELIECARKLVASMAGGRVQTNAVLDSGWLVIRREWKHLHLGVLFELGNNVLAVGVLFECRRVGLDLLDQLIALRVVDCIDNLLHDVVGVLVLHHDEEVRATETTHIMTYISGCCKSISAASE